MSTSSVSPLTASQQQHATGTGTSNLCASCTVHPGPAPGMLQRFANRILSSHTIERITFMTLVLVFAIFALLYKNTVVVLKH